MTSIKPPPNKPGKPPRERLSLPLSPNLTAAVQALGKAFRKPQTQVLADLLALSIPALTRNLDALRVKYEGEQRKALEGVLGTAPGALLVANDNGPGD